MKTSCIALPVLLGSALLLLAGCCGTCRQGPPPVRERMVSCKTVIRMEAAPCRPCAALRGDRQYNVFTQGFERPWPFGPRTVENRSVY